MSDAGRRFAVGLARAGAGALVFALPMLMTMELWRIGFYIDPLKLALLNLLSVPLLVGVSFFVGLEDTFRWRDDLRDALIAYGIGWLVSAVLLTVFEILTFDARFADDLGRVAVQAPPAALGAMLGRSQLGTRGDEAKEDEQKQRTSYAGELLLMATGALFLAINVAPTQEIILIADKMAVWHVLLLVALSLATMHGFVYAVQFQGTPSLPPGTPFWSAFLRFTVAGYALVLLMSVYMLWTFGRTGGMALGPLIQTAVVLGFPAAVGAAGARLII
jgi:putative integral membrane protein (TIGR02587 family)